MMTELGVLGALIVILIGSNFVTRLTTRMD
jgi:hypothetical protein